jgi:hypothetical protein
VEVAGAGVADAVARVVGQRTTTRIVIAGHGSRRRDRFRGCVATRIRRRVPGVPVEEVDVHAHATGAETAGATAGDTGALAQRGR